MQAWCYNYPYARIKYRIIILCTMCSRANFLMPLYNKFNKLLNKKSIEYRYWYRTLWYRVSTILKTKYRYRSSWYRYRYRSSWYRPILITYQSYWSYWQWLLINHIDNNELVWIFHVRLSIDLFLRRCLCYQLQSIEQNTYVLL